MKHILTYQNFITESLLLEFGDASNPFRYKADVKSSSYFNKLIKIAEAKKKQEGGLVDQMLAADLVYTVYGDKETYLVKFGGYISSAIMLPGQSNKSPWLIEYDVSFNVKDSDDEVVTNLGEQYRLLASVTQICLEFIEAATDANIMIKVLGMFPKNDDGTNSVAMASRRGRFYLEYVKKNIKKLEGNWTAEIARDGIILHSGTWSGGNSEWIYNK